MNILAPNEKLYYIPGVYLIVNLQNGKKYVGSSVNMYKRYIRHFWDLKNGKHRNTHLQRAYDKYGEENFTFVALCDCEKEDLRIFEQCMIRKLNPEYNIIKVIENHLSSWSLGKKLSEEHKHKLSLAKKNKPNTDGKKFVGMNVKSPKGEVLEIEPCLSVFCKKHGLDNSTMSKILRKISGYNQHLGWKLC